MIPPILGIGRNILWYYSTSSANELCLTPLGGVLFRINNLIVYLFIPGRSSGNIGTCLHRGNFFPTENPLNFKHTTWTSFSCTYKPRSSCNCFFFFVLSPKCTNDRNVVNATVMMRSTVGTI